MTINQERQLMVSVCCITYNHESYIAEALEGFLMQQTKFSYEILIGEDQSTDKTRGVILSYMDKYPGRIRLLGHDKNMGAIRNQLSLFAEAKGKYIAMCDGDDFWTDPSKLQKQVDFLESHEDYVICCHHTEVINDQNETVYLKKNPQSLEFSYGDVLVGKREETRICSLMMHNLESITNIGRMDWYFESHGSDTLLKLYAIAVTGKKIYVMPEVMACYRWHAGGIWSMINPKVRKSKMVDDFSLIIDNFKYSSSQKRELLRIYIMQYFLFDIRYFNLNNVFKTISALW
jgi:glycosyltransferase involved in cell wall biosynthesis